MQITINIPEEYNIPESTIVEVMLREQNHIILLYRLKKLFDLDGIPNIESEEGKLLIEIYKDLIEKYNMK